MSSYGRQVIATVGRSIKVTADGRPRCKQGGVTIDWSTIAGAGAPATLNDGVDIQTGDKYLRYGQVITKITASGKYGPYDPAAADGRQTLQIGSCFIVNQTMKENDLHSDHPEAIYGGLLFLARILNSGVGAHTLAAGPTEAELLAAFPQMQPVRE